MTERIAAIADLAILLAPYLPSDHARQVGAGDYIDVVMTGEGPPRRVLDLGCGRGDSVDRFRAHDPGIEWIGVDIADSMEAVARQRTDARFIPYDGTTVPLPDASMDAVFSSQVLEHVPDPRAHLREIARVLRPGGVLIGSTSQLEPYHSRSYCNLTPFGFSVMVGEVGLELRELRPGIDGVTLTLRTMFGRPTGFDRWWRTASPLNAEIDAWAVAQRVPVELVNLHKLKVCGQFGFMATKPPSPSAASPEGRRLGAVPRRAGRVATDAASIRRMFAAYEAAIADPSATGAGRQSRWRRIRSGWGQLRRVARR